MPDCTKIDIIGVTNAKHLHNKNLVWQKFIIKLIKVNKF